MFNFKIPLIKKLIRSVLWLGFCSHSCFFVPNVHAHNDIAELNPSVMPQHSTAKLHENRASESTPRLKPQSYNDLSVEQKKILKTITPNEKIPNLFMTLIRNPEMLNALNGIGLYTMKGSTLSPKDRELLILRVAWLTKSNYEFVHHKRIALKLGLSLDEIAKTQTDINFSKWDGPNKYLIKAVDELMLNSTLSDTTWNNLANRFSEKQLLDLIVTVGQYSTVAMLLNTLNVQLEDEFK